MEGLGLHWNITHNYNSWGIKSKNGANFGNFGNSGKIDLHSFPFFFWINCVNLCHVISNSEYEKLNPVKYVPTLVDGDVVVADSFAIILVLISNQTVSFTSYPSYFFHLRY